MTRVALCLALLLACDSDGDGDSWPPWPTWGEAGTVWTCESTCGIGGVESSEWCWNGDEAGIEALLGEDCHPITLGERAWPALTGCRYGCPPEGRGGNSHCGQVCP